MLSMMLNIGKILAQQQLHLLLPPGQGAYLLSLSYLHDEMMQLYFLKCKNVLKIHRTKSQSKMDHNMRNLNLMIERTWLLSNPTTTWEGCSRNCQRLWPTVTTPVPNNFFLDYMNDFGLHPSTTTSTFFDKLVNQLKF